MIETITPAGCGSRARHVLALVLFTGAAGVAAALLGALLGTLGGLVAGPVLLAVAAAAALLAGLREAGWVRVRLPQVRRQVPEPWRRTLPLPVWSAGYGALLGAGVATYQPVATFWVACLLALAVAEPVPAAVGLALFGAARGAVVAWATLGARSPAESVDALVERWPRVPRLNALALVACALLALASPVADAAPLRLGPGSQFDPATSGGALAYALHDGTVREVVVRPAAPGPDVRFSGAASPALDGDLLAYVDATGLRLVRWTTGEELRRIPGAVRTPALRWPLLAYVARDLRGQRIVLLNLETGVARHITRAPAGAVIGRPSLGANGLVWSMASRAASWIVLLDLGRDRRSLVARSRIALLAHPALGEDRLVWVEGRSAHSLLRQRALDAGPAVTVARIRGREREFGAIALVPGSAYATVVVPDGISTLVELALPLLPFAPAQRRDAQATGSDAAPAYASRDASR